MILAGPAWLIDTPEPFRAELGFFRFPVIDPTLPVGEIVLTLGYIIPAAAPSPAAAREMITYLSTSDSQAIFIQKLQEQPF
jgi:multiple sugar transport system substrate-binding protein